MAQVERIIESANNVSESVVNLTSSAIKYALSNAGGLAKDAAAANVSNFECNGTIAAVLKGLLPATGNSSGKAHVLADKLDKWLCQIVNASRVIMRNSSVYSLAMNKVSSICLLAKNVALQ